MQALSERLDALLAGPTLDGPTCSGSRRSRPTRPTPDSLQGRRLVSVGRRAKYLVWTFDDGNRHRAAPVPGRTARRRGAAQEDEAPGLGGPLHLRDGRLTSRRPSPSWCASTARSARRRGGCWRRATTARWPDSGPSRAARSSPSSSGRATATATCPRTCATSTWSSGIGRGWGDDILHRAQLSPFASLRSLSPSQREALLDRGHRGAGRGARARARARGRPLGGEAGWALQGARPLRPALPDARAATRCAGCRSSPTR